jgi:DNA phosphorothioation-associated putative methyltransferase
MPPEGSVRRSRTALHRNDLSRPISLALEAGLITPDASVLDYGCGRGGDIERLRRRGISCVGWDPVHRPRGTRREADVVNLGYVINVIEDPTERAETLLTAWGYARRLLVVAAMTKYDARLGRHEAFEDGYLSSRGTFQKLYSQSELRSLL